MYELIGHLNIIFVVLFVPFVPMILVTVLIQTNVFWRNGIRGASAFWPVLFTLLLAFSVGYSVFSLAGWTNGIWHKLLDILPFVEAGKNFLPMLQVIPMLIGILLTSILITKLVLRNHRATG